MSIKRDCTVFVRNWWKVNSSWPGGLEPDGNARKTVLRKNVTEAEALIICDEYNRNNQPGKLSRKAEYTSNY